MPPSIPPAKGSDPEDVAWALQTADALWRRSERVDALAWLRRAVQAAGEADDSERALALADAAAELTERLDAEPPASLGAPLSLTSVPPPRLHPDASGSVDITIDDPDDIPEVSARFTQSFPPGAGADVDDLLGDLSGGTEPPGSLPPMSVAPDSAPVSVPLPPPSMPPVREASAAKPPPLPPRKSKSKLPPAKLPPARDSEPALPSRPIPLPRGALFEDSTPFLPHSESDEVDAVPSRSLGEQLGQGFDSLVRRPTASPPPVSVKPASLPAPQLTVPAPPQFTEPPPEILEAMAESGPATSPEGASQAEPEADPVPDPEPVREPDPAPAPAPVREPDPDPAPPPPPVIEVDGRLVRVADADAFVDLPDEARDEFVAAGTIHELQRDEEVPAVALCYVLDGEIRVSSAVVDAGGIILKQGEVLRSRGTIDASVPLRLSAHSESAQVVTWNTHAVESAFASCPWVEGDLRALANRTLAVCGATIGPLGERLDESIFLDVMGRFEVSVLLPGEKLAEKGGKLPGLCIVGAGEVAGEQSYGPGDFLFPEGALSLAPSPATLTAGSEGALVLVASRNATQELMVTCPPLLEILAGM